MTYQYSRFSQRKTTKINYVYFFVAEKDLMQGISVCNTYGRARTKDTKIFQSSKKSGSFRNHRTPVPFISLLPGDEDGDGLRMTDNTTKCCLVFLELSFPLYLFWSSNGFPYTSSFQISCTLFTVVDSFCQENLGNIHS